MACALEALGVGFAAGAEVVAFAGVAQVAAAGVDVEDLDAEAVGEDRVLVGVVGVAQADDDDVGPVGRGGVSHVRSPSGSGGRAGGEGALAGRVGLVVERVEGPERAQVEGVDDLDGEHVQVGLELGVVDDDDVGGVDAGAGGEGAVVDARDEADGRVDDERGPVADEGDLGVVADGVAAVPADDAQVVDGVSGEAQQVPGQGGVSGAVQARGAQQAGQRVLSKSSALISSVTSLAAQAAASSGTSS